MTSQQIISGAIDAFAFSGFIVFVLWAPVALIKALCRRPRSK